MLNKTSIASLIPQVIYLFIFGEHIITVTFQGLLHFIFIFIQLYRKQSSFLCDKHTVQSAPQGSMSNEMYHVSVLSGFSLFSDSKWSFTSAKSFKKYLSHLAIFYVTGFLLPTVSMIQMLAYLLSGLRLISFGRAYKCQHAVITGNLMENH